MKVRITLTLDINEQRWADEYGIPLNEVRDDVKAYAIHSIEQNPAIEHLLTNNQQENPQ